MDSKSPINLILEVLRKHPEGLTIMSISELSGLHRHTSTKYIHELMGAGIVFQRSVGPAKLCYLKEKIENGRKKEKIVKGIEERRKGGKYQLKAIVFVILATFLLSETAIFAYQNVSLLNETNLSRISTINTSPLTATNDSNLTIILNNPEIINQGLNESSSNQTSSISNEIINESLNETVENITYFNESPENQTFLNETPEETVEILNETSQESLKPNFSVDLEYPTKITRGEVITVKANAKNNGSLAKNSYLVWALPDGFEVISGNIRENCGDLDTNSSCISEITVKSSLSTDLGLNKIKIVVGYEE